LQTCTTAGAVHAEKAMLPAFIGEWFHPLETGVMFSFSATVPQLDSLTQWVNEFARQSSNAACHLVEDSQDSPVVPFSTGKPGSFLCHNRLVVPPGGSTEYFDKGVGTGECGFESRTDCLSL
jgi:hypothetical protein